jgi:hypothetical protein
VREAGKRYYARLRETGQTIDPNDPLRADKEIVGLMDVIDCDEQFPYLNEDVGMGGEKLKD